MHYIPPPKKELYQVQYPKKIDRPYTKKTLRAQYLSIKKVYSQILRKKSAEAPKSLRLKRTKITPRESASQRA